MERCTTVRLQQGASISSLLYAADINPRNPPTSKLYDAMMSVFVLLASSKNGLATSSTYSDGGREGFGTVVRKWMEGTHCSLPSPRSEPNAGQNYRILSNIPELQPMRRKLGGLLNLRTLISQINQNQQLSPADEQTHLALQEGFEATVRSIDSALKEVRYRRASLEEVIVFEDMILDQTSRHASFLQVLRRCVLMHFLVKLSPHLLSGKEAVPIPSKWEVPSDSGCSNSKSGILFSVSPAPANTFGDAPT